jgi:hypothetical protein
VLFHAGERHPERRGELGNGSVAGAETFEDAAADGVRDGGEGGIEVRSILNHMVQYNQTPKPAQEPALPLCGQD